MMSDFRQSNYPHVWNDRSRSRRIVERDRLDEENRLLDRTFWKRASRRGASQFAVF